MFLLYKAWKKKVLSLDAPPRLFFAVRRRRRQTTPRHQQNGSPRMRSVSGESKVLANIPNNGLVRTGTLQTRLSKPYPLAHIPEPPNYSCTGGFPVTILAIENAFDRAVAIE